MVSRSDAAAKTRLVLVEAASRLLDEGGTDAVTLRAVGALAGVSRGAPYGHFRNKEHLLTTLAVGAWDRLANEVEVIRADQEASPGARLEQAVRALVDVGRRQPHLYALMFSTPADDPEAAEVASRLEKRFHMIVADTVGEDEALRYAALLMSCAHGIAGMEISGHLAKEKWGIDGLQLVTLLISAIECRADTFRGGAASSRLPVALPAASSGEA